MHHVASPSLGAAVYTRNRARSAPRSAAVVASSPYICHATAARAAASPASSAASRLAYKAMLSAITDHPPRSAGKGHSLPDWRAQAHCPEPLPPTAARPARGAGQRITPGLVVQVGQPGLTQGLNGGVCHHRGLLGAVDLEAEARLRRRLGLIMVPRFGLAGVQPAHGDQAEPEVADLGQQPVQRGLVSD